LAGASQSFTVAVWQQIDTCLLKKVIIVLQQLRLKTFFGITLKGVPGSEIQQ
jgi:hypothetical protein